MSTENDDQPAGGKPLTPRPRPHAGINPIRGPQTLDSRDLLAGQSSVFIEHLGEIYRLQTTRQGKLILTK